MLKELAFIAANLFRDPSYITSGEPQGYCKGL
jgi:hypothetical protein